MAKLTKPTLTRIVTREPHRDQVEAAYLLIESMKKGTADRDKALVAEIWRVMFDNTPMSRRTGLTRNQRMTLEIVSDYINEHGVSPTYAEIAAQLGVKPADAHTFCTQLARRKIVSIGGGWRALRILKHPDVI